MFRGSDEHSADYVDVYGAGTHYVEPSGRLLISSSYRWSEDEGPGSSSYVSRVDECPS